MPQDIKIHTPAVKPQTMEGAELRPADLAEMAEAVERAFDYRGDVRLELGNGTSLEGFVFNRDRHRGSLEIFKKGETGATILRYDEIRAIAFDGADAAFGKSWDDWLRKKPSERRAEQEALTEEARRRGEL